MAAVKIGLFLLVRVSPLKKRLGKKIKYRKKYALLCNFLITFAVK